MQLQLVQSMVLKVRFHSQGDGRFNHLRRIIKKNGERKWTFGQYRSAESIARKSELMTLCSEKYHTVDSYWVLLSENWMLHADEAVKSFFIDLSAQNKAFRITQVHDTQLVVKVLSHELHTLQLTPSAVPNGVLSQESPPRRFQWRFLTNVQALFQSAELSI